MSRRTLWSIYTRPPDVYHGFPVNLQANDKNTIEKDATEKQKNSLCCFREGNK